MAGLMETPSILVGDNTTPGLQLSKEMLREIPGILQACRDWGLDFYPTIVEPLTYDEISEIAAYDGFPVRYPHWQWGEEYERMSRGYEYGMHVIYEMVINTNPCYIYILNSNTLCDNVTVVAHATGHNDFFKNNVYFAPTSQNMMNELANHGSRIRRYMAEWGDVEVSKFIDKCLMINNLIDPAAAWHKREYKDRVIQPKREYKNPRRLKVDTSKDFLNDWVNPPEYIQEEKDRIRREELAATLGLWTKPEKDIFGFVKDYAPLKAWQQDVISMLYEEAMYFSPQRCTKVLNEGWASTVDSQIMARWGFAGNEIFNYAHHKAGVLGGKYSMNPYKLGYCMFMDIEERYNKGKFGREYEECEDVQAKEKWDKKLGLGHEKIFEVRKHYNDLTAISEFVTQPFVDKYQLYKWERFPDGTYKIVSKDAADIRRTLLKQHMNGGSPDIRLTDPNHQGKGIMLIEHKWDGRILHPSKTKRTLAALAGLWTRPVHLYTKDKDGNELIYKAGDDDQSKVEQTKAA